MRSTTKTELFVVGLLCSCEIYAIQLASAAYAVGYRMAAHSPAAIEARLDAQAALHPPAQLFYTIGYPARKAVYTMYGICSSNRLH